MVRTARVRKLRDGKRNILEKENQLEGLPGVGEVQSKRHGTILVHKIYQEMGKSETNFKCY